MLGDVVINLVNQSCSETMKKKVKTIRTATMMKKTPLLRFPREIENPPNKDNTPQSRKIGGMIGLNPDKDDMKNDAIPIPKKVMPNRIPAMNPKNPNNLAAGVG